MKNTTGRTEKEDWRPVELQKYEVLQTIEYSLVFLHTQPKHAGKYQCIVRNDASRIHSKPAVLRVIGELSSYN